MPQIADVGIPAGVLYMRVRIGPDFHIKVRRPQHHCNFVGSLTECQAHISWKAIQMKPLLRAAILISMTVGSVSAQDLDPLAGYGISIQEWQAVDPAASKEVIIDRLDAAGWSAEVVSDELSIAETFKLYSRFAAPGVVSYLVVPQNSTGAPIEFSPQVDKFDQTDVQDAFWMSRPTSEQIRQEIIDGMQAAIDALCQMRAKPNSIRAQASAFGVVEVEATWSAAEVCDE